MKLLPRRYRRTNLKAIAKYSSRSCIHDLSYLIEIISGSADVRVVTCHSIPPRPVGTNRVNHSDVCIDLRARV